MVISQTWNDIIFHLARSFIYEFEYGDGVNGPKLGSNDVISNDLQDVVPQDDETQLGKGGSADVGAPLTTATKAKSKQKQSSIWEYFDWVTNKVTM